MTAPTTPTRPAYVSLYQPKLGHYIDLSVFDMAPAFSMSDNAQTRNAERTDAELYAYAAYLARSIRLMEIETEGHAAAWKAFKNGTSPDAADVHSYLHSTSQAALASLQHDLAEVTQEATQRGLTWESIRVMVAYPDPFANV